MNITDKQHREQEARRIIEQSLQDRWEIIERDNWIYKDIDAVTNKAIEELTRIGVTEEEFKSIFDEMYKEERFNSKRDKYKAEMANLLYCEFGEKAPSLQEVNEAVERLINHKAEQIIAARIVGGSDFEKNYTHDIKGLEQAFHIIQFELNRIKQLEEEKQATAMTRLWNHWVKHEGKKFKKVDGKLLGQTDLQKASELTITSSESPIHNLETAYSHGKFGVSEYADHPMANISGKVGGEMIKVVAELVPLNHEELAVVTEIAETLADPLSNLGIKTQQAFAAIIAMWLKRRDQRNRLTLHVNELAESMGYTQNNNGAFHYDALKTVRECVKTLGRTRLTFLTTMPKVRGKYVQTEQPALTVTYLARGVDLSPHGRVEDHWKYINISVNDFVEITVDKGFIKGSDFTLNQLDSVKERQIFLMGRYLEHEWRRNLDKTPGIVTRRIYTLLVSGLNIDPTDIKRPRDVLEKLDTTLEKLLDRGTVKYFEYGPEYADLIQRERISRHLLAKILDITVTIESGNNYQKHYINHGLTHKRAKPLPEIITELKGYLVASNVSQSLAAQELGLTKQTLCNYLSGKHSPSQKNTEKIRSYLDSKNDNLTLPLF